MSMKSLGSLTVDLVANDSQWTAGMSRAERSTKRFEEQTKRQNKELERVVSKIDPVVGKLRELDRQQQVLNRSQKNGLIDQTQFDSLTKKLEAQRRSVRGLDNDFERAGKSAATLNNSLSTVRVLAGAAFAAVGGMGLSRVISETATFGESMNTLRAITGATGEQYEKLEEQARTLGATTRYSAQQSADAQSYLARAGFDVNQTLAATPQILSLATAGQLDLARAADISSNVLGQFNLQVGDLSRVNDVLAKAANSSNTTVEQLATALKKAGPIANSANISLEQTSALISALSDNGLQGEIAGTGVLGFIRQLSNVTPAAADALAKYGLTVKDVSLETNSLSTVLHRLKAANFTTSDSFKIFASEAGPAAEVLAESADKIDELTLAYENSAGTADAMARIIGQGLSNSIKTFNSVLSESVLQMGQGGLGKSFEFVIQQASGVISVWNGMGDVYAETNELTDEQAKRNEILAQTIQTTAAAVSAYSAVLLGYTAASKTAAIATAIFTKAAKANPIIAAVAGAAAAIAIIYSFKDQIISVGDTTLEVSEYVSEIWRVFVNRISGYWDKFDDVVSDVLSKFDINVSIVVDQASKYWESYVSYIVNITSTAINSVIGLFVAVADSVFVTVNTIYDNYVYMFDRVLATAGGFAKDFKNILDGNLSFGNLKAEIEEGFSGTTNVFSAIAESAQNALSTDYVKNSLDAISSVIDEAENNIRDRDMYRPLTDHLFDLNTAASTTIQSQNDLAQTFDQTEESTAANAKALRDSQRAAEQYNNSIQTLVDRLDPLGKKFRDLKSDEMLLQTALMQNKVSITDYFKLLEKMKLEQAEAVKGTDAPELSVSSEFGGVSSEVSNISSYADKLNEWRTDELSVLEDLNESKLLSDVDYFERKAELEETYAAKTNEIAIASKNAQLAGAASLFGELTSLTKGFAGEQSGIYKAMFAVEKAFAIASSIISIQKGIASAASLTFPANIPAMASVAASTAVIVSTIQSTGLAGMAHDGIDSVPNDGTWLLQKGERVTTANTSAKLDKTLTDIQENNTNNNNSKIVFAPQISVGQGSNITSSEIEMLMKKEHARFRNMLVKEKQPGGLLYT